VHTEHLQNIFKSGHIKDANKLLATCDVRACCAECWMMMSS